LSGACYSAGDFDYWVASSVDEPAVRDILARVATGGQIRISFQREPDAFGGAYGAVSQDFILAGNRRSGHFVGVCERVVREAYVNGEIRRLPYLAGLRVVTGFRHRMLVLRGGFEAVRQLLNEPRDLPFALTSIMSDNTRGMPHYEPAGELSTFALAARGHAQAELATDADLPKIAELLQAQAREHQFANVWTLDRLRATITAGWLQPRDFLVLRSGGVIRGCAALWDQTAQRQIVVAGYANWLGRTRPLINLAARLSGLPRLPPPGGRLRSAYLSHVAVDDAAPEDLLALVAAARAEARRRGIELLLMGLASAHPLTPWLRKLHRQRELQSRLFVVRWPEAVLAALDPELRVAPELALM
jgi:hypothetical protein